jgi:malate synthase
MIAKLLGAVKEEKAVIESEIEASAPRFDRSKARIIMDVLKRQLVSPLYIQHSPRVLFVIADKDDETRERILDAIYYVDKDGNPIFRDSGEPSRKKVVEAALRGIVPNYAIEAHDYVHDVIHHTSQ